MISDEGLPAPAPAGRRPVLPVRKITRRKLSDEVFDRLLKEIENGGYAPNAHIPSERELMAAYGVGRPAIREAMQRLEKLGLIVINHGERARVSQPTVADVIGQIEHAARHILATQPQSLSQLQDARIFFEIGMVREAARRPTPPISPAGGGPQPAGSISTATPAASSPRTWNSTPPSRASPAMACWRR